MGQSARKEDNRSPWLHAGRRFGDVLVGMDADHELNWMFNRAGEQIEQPSNMSGANDGWDACGLDAAVGRADALHAARKIWGRLQQVGARQLSVLEALYTERAWPSALSRGLGYMIGVVEAMPGVRTEYLVARILESTRATSTTAWLEELVVQSPEVVDAWREEGVRACERALSAYQKARGNGPCVVSKEEGR
jgi:hypothetical protein